MSRFEYTFRKTAARPAETWRLDGKSLVSGDDLVIELTSVKGGTFSDMPSGENWVSSLVLEHSGGSTKIACNDQPSGASRAQYMALVVALLGDLAAVSPNAAFRSGGGRVMTYLLLAVGTILSLIGVYAMGGAVLGQFGQATQFALSMGAMALIFGIFLGYCGSPWSKPTTRSPQDLLDWLRSWLHQPAA